MANGKISSYGSAGAIQATDIIPIVRPGSPNQNLNVTAANLLATASLLGYNAVSTSTYTLVLTDASKRVDLTNTGGCAVTIPPNSSVAFPVGTTLVIRQNNSDNGQCSIVAGAGVTIQSKYNRLNIENTQFAEVFLEQIYANTWQLVGDLTA